MKNFILLSLLVFNSVMFGWWGRRYYDGYYYRPYRSYYWGGPYYGSYYYRGGPVSNFFWGLGL